MAKISIVDLEVFYCVGVSDEERAKPQRLLLTVDMNVDTTSAALSDRIEKTIDYHELTNVLVAYGNSRNWKLLEKLATNMADMILAEYKPQAVMVEVKKFPFPNARHVSVTVKRERPK